ncbi:MAG TPA: DUF4340 domain-containing protein [Terriglobales bacterium]|nr:DUF4340 domain-containing protein [Terriglobales bacterium]
MKGLVRLAIAVVILAGLAGLYLWLGRQNKPAEAATPAVATFDSGSVQQISIQDGSNPPVALAKQGGNWRLLQPYSYAADNGEVSTVLSTLSGVHPSEQLGPQRDLSIFGLDKPSTVQLVLAQGKKLQFDFGSDVPAGGGVYLRTAASHGVVTVPAYIKTDAVKSAFDLQDRTVLHFSSDSLTGLSFQQKGKKASFERKDNKWPGAKQSDLQTLVDTLHEARMDALTDVEGKDAAKYGLATPDGVLTLTWKGGQGRVEVGTKKGTDYYARSSDSPAIFTLAGYIVTDMQALLKPPAKSAAKNPATKKHPRES